VRIYIAVPCFNRKRLTEIALRSLMETKRPDDLLVGYNDGSHEYTTDWLRQFCDRAESSVNVGIERQRQRHFIDFWKSDYDLLYFTDNDTLHDLDWRATGITLLEKYSTPVCLYNTTAHASLPDNLIDDDPESPVIWRRYAPGVSYLMNRRHVGMVMPHVHRLQNFDWDCPRIWGNRMATSRVSWLDHLAHGGIHHKGTGYDSGDRALNPTPWLVERRRQLVAQLEATP
jgi:glycosyltransferase involved in cell wall biosynthesis